MVLHQSLQPVWPGCHKSTVYYYMIQPCPSLPCQLSVEGHPIIHRMTASVGQGTSFTASMVSAILWQFATPWVGAMQGAVQHTHTHVNYGRGWCKTMKLCTFFPGLTEQNIQKLLRSVEISLSLSRQCFYGTVTSVDALSNSYELGRQSKGTRFTTSHYNSFMVKTDSTEKLSTFISTQPKCTCPQLDSIPNTCAMRLATLNGVCNLLDWGHSLRVEYNTTASHI